MKLKQYLLTFDEFIKDVQKKEHCPFFDVDLRFTSTPKPILYFSPYEYTNSDDLAIYDVFNSKEYNAAETEAEIYSLWLAEITERVLPYVKNSIPEVMVDSIDNEDRYGTIVTKHNGKLIIFDYNQLDNLTGIRIHESIPSWCIGYKRQKPVKATAKILSTLDLWRVGLQFDYKDAASDSIILHDDKNEYFILHEDYDSKEKADEVIQEVMKKYTDKEKLIIM